MYHLIANFNCHIMEDILHKGTMEASPHEQLVVTEPEGLVVKAGVEGGYTPLRDTECVSSHAADNSKIM